jgi:hypothetical protein
VLHLRPRISDDLDVLGEEFVAELFKSVSRLELESVSRDSTYETEECRELY